VPYIFTHDDKTERDRLASIEAAFDPYTIGYLERVGVQEGWRCLEVGAGGGSITEWLCRTVGPKGTVVATDLETTFLKALDFPQLEVRRHDIAVDDLEENSFDLVCARKVLEHFADPKPALDRMNRSLRPGGTLLIEDADLVAIRHVSTRDGELFDRVHTEFIDAMASAGFNPRLGRCLGDELRRLGCEQVELHGQTTEWTAAGDHPGGTLNRKTTERLRDRMLQRGNVTAEEIDQYLADIQSEDFHAITGINFVAWGRKPR
jgi:SAM-dependent methyltransferase